MFILNFTQGSLFTIVVENTVPFTFLKATSIDNPKTTVNAIDADFIGSK